MSPGVCFVCVHACECVFMLKKHELRTSVSAALQDLESQRVWVSNPKLFAPAVKIPIMFCQNLIGKDLFLCFVIAVLDGNGHCLRLFHCHYFCFWVCSSFLRLPFPLKVAYCRLLTGQCLAARTQIWQLLLFFSSSSSTVVLLLDLLLLLLPHLYFLCWATQRCRS